MRQMAATRLQQATGGMEFKPTGLNALVMSAPDDTCARYGRWIHKIRDGGIVALDR